MRLTSLDSIGSDYEARRVVLLPLFEHSLPYMNAGTIDWEDFGLSVDSSDGDKELRAVKEFTKYMEKNVLIVGIENSTGIILHINAGYIEGTDYHDVMSLYQPDGSGSTNFSRNPDTYVKAWGDFLKTLGCTRIISHLIKDSLMSQSTKAVIAATNAPATFEDTTLVNAQGKLIEHMIWVLQ
jgi:hypothetical protein